MTTTPTLYQLRPVVVVVGQDIMSVSARPLQMRCHKFQALERRGGNSNNVYEDVGGAANEDQRLAHDDNGDGDGDAAEIPDKTARRVSPFRSVVGGRISMRSAQIIHKFHSIFIKRTRYTSRTGSCPLGHVPEIRSLRKACN